MGPKDTLIFYVTHCHISRILTLNPNKFGFSTKLGTRILCRHAIVHDNESPRDSIFELL